MPVHSGQPSPSSAAPTTGVPHVPALRWGATYESLDTAELLDHRGGAAVANVSQVNAGIIRRDLNRASVGAEALRRLTTADLLAICRKAGKLFMDGTLPLGLGGETQSPQDYIETLCATSGLPHTLGRRNMQKIHTVFTEMPTILRGLTRGLDPAVLDPASFERGLGEHDGIPVSFSHSANALGVVLPSNSPGVNSIWMPAIPFKTPVVIKPGREEPWTPLRIIHAFVAAGCPAEAFGFYPTDHEGAATVIECCPRSLLFGDEKTTAAYRSNPAVEIHGPGRSKIIIGPDVIDEWRDHLDVLVSSVVDNGGRSCLNVSSIFVPAHADDVADALAKELAPIEPRPADDPQARLSAHPNARIAEAIDAAIDSGTSGGAEDVTARYRQGPRRVEAAGATYLLPTIIRCGSVDHALANTEFMFPFTSVVEVPPAPPEQLLETMGPSLVVTVISRDPQFIRPFVESPLVERLNVGPVPTTRVDWDQPHEGNLFEFLYTRRAIHRKDDW